MDDDRDLVRLLSWGDLLETVSYYDLLGVVDNADEATIRRAFHDFALAFHPDQYRDREPSTTAVALRVYQRGVEAYRVLCRPELRARYDRQLTSGQLRLDESSPSEPAAVPTPSVAPPTAAAEPSAATTPAATSVPPLTPRAPGGRR